MTKPTIDERIEKLRKEGQTFSATGHRGRALAIIEELKAENASLAARIRELQDDLPRKGSKR